MIERREAEYKRNGALCLIASFDVATGEVCSYTTGPTRNEEDFLRHITGTVANDPTACWTFVADHLNTHMSASLVAQVASWCGLTEDLGVKGKTGHLANMASRETFLNDPAHRIRFVYTPKHCSWLNQVEIWFSVLVRRLLKRGDFKTVTDLSDQIAAFIKYFNATLAHPYRWTYTGRALKAA